MCVCLCDKDHFRQNGRSLKGYRIIVTMEHPAEINDTLPLSHSIQTVTGKHSDKGNLLFLLLFVQSQRYSFFKRMILSRMCILEPVR